MSSSISFSMIGSISITPSPSFRFSAPSKASCFPALNSSSLPSLRKKSFNLLPCRSSESEDVPASEGEDDEWLKKLPEKEKPLYSHSLPCIESWLKGLGFYQSKEDRAVWKVENPDWHAQLSLDVTDLYIRYMKSGSGNLEKDVERRFSYALSREDIENAVLGGP
ncbi:hypothetical protein LINGRAHAP2_LOCUS22266 [Linum grandiflorum]